VPPPDAVGLSALTSGWALYRRGAPRLYNALVNVLQSLPRVCAHLKASGGEAQHLMKFTIFADRNRASLMWMSGGNKGMMEEEREAVNKYQ